MIWQGIYAYIFRNFKTKLNDPEYKQRQKLFNEFRSAQPVGSERNVGEESS